MGKKVRQSISPRLKEMVKGKPQSVNIAESSIAVPTDEQAQLKTQIESNTTPLGISATYTGAGFDTMADGINYTWLTGLCLANQAGTLAIQQSVNGVNFITTDTVALAANVTSRINFDILLRHVRFQLVNGATAQTSLQLYGFTTFK